MGPVAEADVTLFTILYSTYAQRVRIALEEKSIPYKIVNVNPLDKPQLLVESNPIYEKVPTIVHKGKTVAESLVILEYLEDEWPLQAPLLPKDAFEKSKVRFWTDFIYKSYTKLIEFRTVKAGTPEHPTWQEESVKALKTLEGAMAAYSTEGPFFTGEKFGYLDVVLGPLESFLYTAEKLGGLVVPGPDELPRLHNWIDEVKTRPSFSSVLPTKEDTAEFFGLPQEKRFEWFASSATR